MQKNLHTKNKSRTFALELRKQHRGVEQLVARWAHNPKVVCSSQASATRRETFKRRFSFLFYQYTPKEVLPPLTFPPIFASTKINKIQPWQISRKA